MNDKYFNPLSLLHILLNQGCGQAARTIITKVIVNVQNKRLKLIKQNIQLKYNHFFSFIYVSLKKSKKKFKSKIILAS